ncbi:uncharacterized protein LOC129602475 [Paramacrobiotus metropolitanus]|uniref:uncharacterized protein LOC129602475 n=1 Tax=Paramacrobiotus metropolitanus TaxID=2943436 RepID=UPI00244583C8|nr:uncharacterized protein LOC129602475 [Paramacrobiotus metropolitanus]XP_055357474.1 uncharacterized protein LOC129602475 [Paramacrobiotus metropolitanus]
MALSADSEKPPAGALADIASENSSLSSGRLFANGQEMLSRCVNSRKRAVKADAVKTQQTVTTVYKENMTEKTEIQRIDLAKALSSNRLSSRGAAHKMELNLALSSNGRSVRSYFRTTAQEIHNLLDRAQANIPVCQDDIAYLKDKFCHGYVMNLREDRMTTFANIALTFSIIAKNQVVDVATQLDLAKATFDASLDSSYDGCRLKFLKMFQLCAESSNAKLPENVTKILREFQKSSECTRDMKKILWIILKKDDSNLQDSFAAALEILQHTKGEQDEMARDSTEYIWEQVANPVRALHLEERVSFSSTLIAILIGAEKSYYSLDTASQVAAILDDFLAHDPEELPRALKEGFEARLTNFQESSHVYASWGDKDSEPHQKLYKKSIIGIILKTVSHPKFDSGPSTISLLDILSILVQPALDPDTDQRLAAHIIIVLGNVAIQKKVSHIPGVERLASRLRIKDGVDADGVIWLDSDQMAKPMGFKYVSAVIAQMLLQLIFTSKEPLQYATTLDEITAAIGLSPDKNTQIRCAECVFHAVVNRYPNMTEKYLWLLLPLTKSAVADIRINCTAAYCLLLEHLTYSERKQTLTASELTDLALMYTFEPVVLLGCDGKLNLKWESAF